jgi:hypothetical protein
VDQQPKMAAPACYPRHVRLGEPRTGCEIPATVIGLAAGCGLAEGVGDPVAACCFSHGPKGWLASGAPATAPAAGERASGAATAGGTRHAQLAAGVDEGFREDNQATADIGVRRSDDDVAGYAPGSRDHTVGRADELTGLDGRDGAGWFDRGILKDGGPNARMFTCGSPAIPQLAYSLWIPETNFSRRCCARFGYELGSIYEILPFHGR